MTLPDLKNAHQLVERVESTRLVFRVYDDNSHQDYCPSIGITAHADLIDLSDLDAVERSVQERLVFSNSRPTPWISTTRRWLWAVWEANRRFNTGKSNVRIAIIDLNACLTANEEVSIPSLGYAHLPYIHALSGLSKADIIYRRFADMADEILIYYKVPPSAIISICQFDPVLSTLPREFTRSLPSSSDPELSQAFRSNHGMVADRFLRDKESGEWSADRAGELCATAALALLHDAYTRLASDVGTIVKSTWKTRTRAPTRRSLRMINRRRESDADSNQRSECGKDHNLPFPQAFVESLVPKIIDRHRSWRCIKNTSNLTIPIVVGVPDPFCRNTIEVITSEVIIQTPCGTNSKRSTYERFLTHKKSLMSQVMNHIYINDSLIRVRHTSRKVDHFRSIALELARTVPLGLMDQLRITRSEWGAMKHHMLTVIVAKLAPLYQKLDAIMIEPMPRIELVDGARHLDAGVKWISKEPDYPLWWEQCGVQKSLVDHRPGARFC